MLIFRILLGQQYRDASTVESALNITQGIPYHKRCMQINMEILCCL